jgi:hypothetical protein
VGKSASNHDQEDQWHTSKHVLKGLFVGIPEFETDESLTAFLQPSGENGEDDVYGGSVSRMPQKMGYSPPIRRNCGNSWLSTLV